MNPPDHPLMKQVQQDIAQANAREEQQRALDNLEAQWLRQNQAQLLHR